MHNDGYSPNGDHHRKLLDPILAGDEVIPDQDLVPLSVLNHPVNQRLETDFAAYDPPTSTVLPSVDGPDAV